MAHWHSVDQWDEQTKLREREVELMEESIKTPDDRTVRDELANVRQQLAAHGCDTGPMLRPTMRMEGSPVESMRKRPVHFSAEPEPEPEPEQMEQQPHQAEPKPQRSVLRTSTAAGGLAAPPSYAAPKSSSHSRWKKASHVSIATTSSRQQALGAVANYFATRQEPQNFDLGGGKVVKGYDTTGDGQIDSVDISGDGQLDAKVRSDGDRVRVSLDGPRARQKSMANRSAFLAARASSKLDSSTRSAEAQARLEKLHAKRCDYYTCDNPHLLDRV